MNPKQPDILLVMTDQQRFDTIAALGYPWMLTPNLDRLVHEGTAFTSAYCTAPACVPSRASFFNLRYPQRLGVHHNFSPWGSSWVQRLQAAGYRTVSIGKMHTVPHDEPCGFDQRFIVENKIRPLHEERPHGGFFDQWDYFLADHGRERPSKAHYRSSCPDFSEAVGAYLWDGPEALHADVFVGERAVRFLERRKFENPLFLQVGFPGPHPPYDPPQRLVELYRDTEFPCLPFTFDERQAQPAAQEWYRQGMIEHQRDGVAWADHVTWEQRQRLWRHYAANVTLIDEQIGTLLHLLERQGRLDNTVVLFLSDHGDCLGDHGHIQKWTMYEPVVRIPAILRAPGLVPAGRRAEGLIEHFDLAATLLDLAGIVPGGDEDGEGDAWSLHPDYAASREYVFAGHSGDHILGGTRYLSMVRDRRFKLVHYLGGTGYRDGSGEQAGEPSGIGSGSSVGGELYDLERDPDEVRNRWDDPELGKVKERLTRALLEHRLESDYRQSLGSGAVR